MTPKKSNASMSSETSGTPTVETGNSTTPPIQASSSGLAPSPSDIEARPRPEEFGTDSPDGTEEVLKFCKFCTSLKPTHQFSLSRGSYDGFYNACKTCDRARNLRYSNDAGIAKRRRDALQKRMKRGRPAKRKPYRTIYNPEGL